MKLTLKRNSMTNNNFVPFLISINKGNEQRHQCCSRILGRYQAVIWFSSVSPAESFSQPMNTVHDVSLTFSRQWIWSVWSSWMKCCVACLTGTNVSKKPAPSIFRVRETYSKDADSRFLPIPGSYLLHYMVPHSRRSKFSAWVLAVHIRTSYPIRG
jgi:hypothetical protein